MYSKRQFSNDFSSWSITSIAHIKIFVALGRCEKKSSTRGAIYKLVFQNLYTINSTNEFYISSSHETSIVLHVIIHRIYQELIKMKTLLVSDFLRIIHKHQSPFYLACKRWGATFVGCRKFSPPYSFYCTEDAKVNYENLQKLLKTRLFGAYFVPIVSKHVQLYLT